VFAIRFAHLGSFHERHPSGRTNRGGDSLPHKPYRGDEFSNDVLIGAACYRHWYAPDAELSQKPAHPAHPMYRVPPIFLKEEAARKRPHR